jgi:hypothetical protein
VLEWFRKVVERAIVVEFNRFIAAGHLATRVAQIGQVDNVADLASFSGMNV